MPSELREKNSLIPEKYIALALFAIFWFCFLYFNGTFTSGFHFMDDHEIPFINKGIHDNGLFNTIFSVLQHDFTIRFRPLYYIHRVMETKIFGTNLVEWSIYNCLLAVLTSYFLFMFLYIQGFKFFHSILFAFITLVGEPCSIWWRLGPNETIGLLLLSASLFLLADSIYKKKKYYLIISFLLMFLCSLCKESFVLFIPAYILIFITLIHQNNKETSIIKLFTGNLLFISCLLIVLIAELYIVVFMVGTNKIVYAGVDSKLNLKELLKSIFAFFTYTKYLYALLFGCFLVMQAVKSWKINYTKLTTEKIDYLLNISIFMVIIIPQFILYFKSGFVDRYYIPVYLGFSFFIFFLLRKTFENTSVNLFSKRAFVFVLLYVLYSFLKNYSIPDARSFTKEGIITHKFLSAIVSNTHPGDSIIIVTDPSLNAEREISLYRYLTITGERKNVTFYVIHSKDTISEFRQHLRDRFSREYADITTSSINKDYKCFVILPSNNTAFQAKLDSTHLYRRTEIDKYFIYTKETK